MCTATTTDFEVFRLGTVWVFSPRNDRAWEHAWDMFDTEDSFGGFDVEHRYGLDIVNDLVNAHGFTVAIDGRTVASITPV